MNISNKEAVNPLSVVDIKHSCKGFMAVREAVLPTNLVKGFHFSSDRRREGCEHLLLWTVLFQHFPKISARKYGHWVTRISFFFNTFPLVYNTRNHGNNIPRQRRRVQFTEQKTQYRGQDDVLCFFWSRATRLLPPDRTKFCGRWLPKTEPSSAQAPQTLLFWVSSSNQRPRQTNGRRISVG